MFQQFWKCLKWMYPYVPVIGAWWWVFGLIDLYNLLDYYILVSVSFILADEDINTIPLFIPGVDLPKGSVMGIDILRISPLDGAQLLSNHDITEPSTHVVLQRLLPEARADVILSDMAPNASGLRELDHERLVTMCLSVLDLADKVLRPGGSLICKYWDGALAHELQQRLSSMFQDVRTVKPRASRKESAELFFLARMFKVR